jgi:hypothetical protein
VVLTTVEAHTAILAAVAANLATTVAGLRTLHRKVRSNGDRLDRLEAPPGPPSDKQRGSEQHHHDHHADTGRA